jgi:hypothetical protein
LDYQLGECELQGDCAAPRQPNFDSNPDGNGVRGRFASSYVESFEQIVSSTGSAMKFAEQFAELMAQVAEKSGGRGTKRNLSTVKQEAGRAARRKFMLKSTSGLLLLYPAAALSFILYCCSMSLLLYLYCCPISIAALHVPLLLLHVAATLFLLLHHLSAVLLPSCSICLLHHHSAALSLLR